MSTIQETRNIIPVFSGLYEKVSPLAEPLIRVAAGAFLMPHGAQKLFGAFDGGGLNGTAQFFGSIGIEPAVFMALLVGTVEFFGGLALAIGFITRPAAISIVILMGVAASQIHSGAGFFWTNGGFEYPLFWGLVALAFVLRGGGNYSLDRKIGYEF